jgi:predicted transcriptional regulator
MDQKKSILIELDVDVHSALKEIAKREDRSLVGQTRWVLERFIEADTKKEESK